MQEVSGLASINGVDPIVVNNIKVKTQKSVVIETHKTKVSEDKKEKKRQDQGREQPRSLPPMQELLAAVDKLNELLQRNKIKLCFQLINEQGNITVKLIEIDSGNLISEIMPERILELLEKFTTTGFTINELI